MDHKQYDEFMNLLLNSKNIMALTGAGISTSAGIPDFRSPKGIYVDPSVDGERVFDINVFKEDPSIFNKFFAKLYPIIQSAQPTKAHAMLKKLQDMGKLSSIITQNIDGLHNKAGNTNVIEVHGHIREFVCIRSVHHRQDIDTISNEFISSAQAVICPECQSLMKPDIIFFGEYVKNLEKVLTEIQKADLLFIIGTSLTVYPVSTIPTYCSDSTKIVILNASETPYDYMADLIFRDDIETFVERTGLVAKN
ncbi:MAG: SIR2 family NAD-dependent protein deacylase [Brevinemataceae bacterium]